MTKKDKRLKKLLDGRTITFPEAVSLLESLNFVKDNKGKTSGSRILFFRESDGAMIRLHKPHPGIDLKDYQKEEIIKILKERGDLDE